MPLFSWLGCTPGTKRDLRGDLELALQKLKTVKNDLGIPNVGSIANSQMAQDYLEKKWKEETINYGLGMEREIDRLDAMVDDQGMFEECTDRSCGSCRLATAKLPEIGIPQPGSEPTPGSKPTGFQCTLCF